MIDVICGCLCLQEAFPMRLKGLHFINEPWIFSSLFALVKPFLKEKTVNRVCIILLRNNCTLPYCTNVQSIMAPSQSQHTDEDWSD